MVGNDQHCHFVLVEPATAANVGAAARAMKTMGFTKLRLVNPQCDHLGEEAHWVAHASRDILRHAEVFASLAEAVADLDLTIATSADQRDVRKSFVAAENLKQKMQADTRFAVVFGREKNGLTNEEMESCDWISSISMAQIHPTLNLGQSVMLYAYLLAQHPPALDERRQRSLAFCGIELQSFKQRVRQLLPDLGIFEGSRSARKILGRLSHLSMEDLRLAFYILNKVEKRLPRPTKVSSLQQIGIMDEKQESR